MNQIEKLMLDAVQNRQDWKKRNTKVVHRENYTTVLLDDKSIAKIDWNSRQIVVRTGGCQTKTTKSRLNAIIRNFTSYSGIYQSKGHWFLAEKPFLDETTFVIFPDGEILVLTKTKTP